MPDVLTYVLHYEGAFNKNSLGAVSEGAARAKDIGGACHAVVVGGDDLTDELCSSLGAYGATKVFRAKGEEGLAQPVIDVMAKVIDDHGHSYALFGGGLLGFEIGAGDVGIDASLVGAGGSRVACGDFHAPEAKAAGQVIEDEDTTETVEKIVAWLQERKLI